MTISRQSDSIWAEAAMGYGHSHSPARDDDHHGVGSAARAHGEAMGRKHAGESIREYHRDEKGRFAPMPHHHKEHDESAGKIARQHRDGFVEAYHRGFHEKVREHEKEEKDKAERGHKHSSMTREAIHLDPVTGEVVMDDPGRFHYQLAHGGSDEGYVPPTWLEQMQAGAPNKQQWKARQPTEENPYRYDVDTLKNIANDEHFGLGLGMSEKAPFSRADVGLATGDMRKKENRGRVALRPGELASEPIRVEDHMGNVHTFVHQVTAPNLNPHDPERPERGGAWVVSLHHHVSRPDGTAEWLPSEVTHHVDATHGRKASDDLHRDIWGQLHANSDMVTMYGAGAQRVGDKHTTIEYEFPHPKGDVVYRAKLANAHNKWDGYYFDPTLPEKHQERLPGGSQRIVTGRGLEREFPHDPKSPTRMVTIEGSDSPGPGTIAFNQEDLPGLIQHVWNGLGVRPDRPSWAQWQQHQLPNRGGKPAGQMIRGQASVRAWSPEFNIHRSQERLPVRL